MKNTRLSCAAFGRQTALVALLALSALFLAPRVLAQNFTNVPIAGLVSIPIGGPTWTDYDDDGKLEFFVPSASGNDSVQPLWRNAGGTFTNSGIVITRDSVNVGDLAVWADYDNDGKLDFIEITAPSFVLWHNTGTGFTDVTSAAGIDLGGIDLGGNDLGGIEARAAAWGDFDNDGRPDFIVTRVSAQPQIWRNTTNGFLNVTTNLAPGLPIVFTGSHIAWGDYDNDGRLDFVLSGGDAAGTPLTQIWRNTGDGFTNVTVTVAPGLPGVKSSDSEGKSSFVATAWGDYDNDGWLDLLMTGHNANPEVSTLTQLWHNNGGTFTNVPVPGLTQLGSGASVAWGDYDNDGRLDFLLEGAVFDSISGYTNFTQLWRNTGSTFTNMPIPGLPQVREGGTAWGDYDNDGRLDFLLRGTTTVPVLTRYIQLWRNLALATNTPPTAPTGLSVTPTTNGVLLAWNAASDAQTPPAGLTYNVRAGTTPGGNDLITGNVIVSTGVRRLPELGNAQMNRFFRFNTGNVPLGQKVYWSVQAIDTAFAGGSFAAESVFTNGFALVAVPGLTAGESAAWGDYDNDGWLDVLVTGFGVTKLGRNTGSTFTNVPIAGLPGLANTAVAWSDFDNDGRLDFIITGSTDGFETGATSQLWRNTGSGFSNVTASQLPGLPNLYRGTLSWGDYNHDGRLDLVVSGSDDTDTPFSQLWRNTGSNFVNVTASVVPGLMTVGRGALAWADFDGDGRLDLLAAGSNVPQLWRNTGSNFVNVSASVAPGLPPMAFASAAWGDYDNDGRPDFVIMGETNSSPAQKAGQVWRNTGSGFTNVPIHGLPGLTFGNVQWGDYDADGWLDFLMTGVISNVTATAQLWRNTGTGFAQTPFSGLLGSDSSTVAWADYDNDGQLDFLNTGSFGGQLWHNQLGVTNTPPTAPTGLVMTATTNGVLLSWNSATDGQTPASGLTYNVRAGSTPSGIDLFAGHVNATNGFRRVPAMGNANLRHSLPLTGLTNGQTVYWSVQAVDTAFAGGPFATETSVVTIPRLSIASSSATNALVSWTPPTFGWVLQQSTNLSISNWTTTASGSANPATVPATNAATFYRLLNP